MDAKYSEYFAQRQCAAQWRGVLSALGAELSAQLSPSDLRTLMHRTGGRFAQEQALSVCETVAHMQAAMNDVWQATDWGWVELDEQPAALFITHHCPPLQAAFGHRTAAWWPGFLEGVYQAWFAQLGAGNLLHVTQVSEADDFGSLRLQLAQT